MKKFLLFLLILILSPISAQSADIWDDFSADSGNIWDNQKPVTNQEFEKAIDTLTADKKKKEAKKKKKKIKKLSGGGTSLHEELNPTGNILELTPLSKPKTPQGQLLNIPVDIIIDNKLVEKGFYNVYGEKERDGNVYLSLYQSQYFVGKVKAYETKNDYGSDSIDFVKMIPYDKDYIKIVFGSMDFNAYTYVRYKDDSSSEEE